MTKKRLLSSLTKKYVMAFAGLFLILFLFVHLTINMFLLFDEELFNLAANFMASNIIIKVFEVVLFGGILIHIIYGLILQFQNWAARPQRYKVPGYSQQSVFSKYMIHTAAIIFVFLVGHLIGFYFKAKFGDIGEVIINGKHFHDMATMVIAAFQNEGIIVFYIIAFLFLGFHLHHGFQSAFQSLGLENDKYTPCIKRLGVLVSLVIAGGFVIIPLVIYFGNY